MNASFIQEPELQFGTGRHIDIRFGIANYKPLDYRDPLAPKKINLGIIGTEKSIAELRGWLDSCAQGIDAKVSDQPNLFVRFPGFGDDTPFDSKLVFDARLERPLSSRDLPRHVDKKGYNAFIADLADAYIKEAVAASERGASVVVCAIPIEALSLIDPDDPEPDDTETEAADTLEQDFHDLLKARAMRYPVVKPIQIVLPMTYSENVRRRQKRKKTEFRRLQDPATRAWNFHTALYYKASGAPWRLIREEADLTCCFVGVSFYKTLDGSMIYTSSAQVFNERGQGLIVRGSPAKFAKDDRDVHMTGEGSYNLIKDALQAYRDEHRNTPARVVVQKTSSFDREEIDGFIKGIEERDIELYDLIHVRRSYTRLFRVGLYPPLRGTAVQVDEDVALLYTRGAVDFYQTYPGQYVPRPIEITAEDSDRSIGSITTELLAMTKMNWNNTEFDNSMPITIQAARKVGKILKYLSKDDKAQSLYAYYM
jgi:hypothetical protein